MNNHKKTEQKVKDLLNNNGYKVELHKSDYNSYDIFGTNNDGDKLVVEVKKRNKKYDTWQLEDAKYKGILKDVGSDISKLYCVVFENEYMFYDMDKMIANTEMISRFLPRTTAFRDKDLIKKDVYEFDASAYEFVLKLNNNE